MKEQEETEEKRTSQVSFGNKQEKSEEHQTNMDIRKTESSREDGRLDGRLLMHCWWNRILMGEG